MQLSLAAAGQVKSQINLDCWQVLRMEAKSLLTTCRFTLMSSCRVPIPSLVTSFPEATFL